jgi:hypothetical protein
MFVVDPDLVMLAESVRIRDWIPQPGTRISIGAIDSAIAEQYLSAEWIGSG